MTNFVLAYHGGKTPDDMPAFMAQSKSQKCTTCDIEAINVIPGGDGLWVN